MNIKETLQNSKRIRLLKANPEIKEVAEIVIDEKIMPAIEGIEEKIDQQINEVKKEIENIELQKGDPGDDGYTPQKGIDYFDGEPGNDGNDYILTEDDKNEIASKIKVPVIEKVIEKTEFIKEQPIITNEIKEVAVADKAEVIAEKLNTLEGKVDMTVIKGLYDTIRNLQAALKEKNKPSSRGGGSLVEAEDLSDQCDGANKTFTVRFAIKNVISLTCSQFPTVFRRNIDYTIRGKQITFTDTVSAPESGQTLDISYTR